MPIYAKPPGGTGELHPEGLFAAVCVDVIDRGMVDTGAFGFKHMIDIRWLTSVEDEETGHRLWVSRRYNNSLHEKANLRRDLQTWRGQKFTAEQLQRFDLETLLGKPCQVQIVQDTKPDGAVYANVTAVLPAAQGVPKIVPKKGEYTRVVARPGAASSLNDTTPVNNGPMTVKHADDIPF
jgi:hypothetical protein